MSTERFAAATTDELRDGEFKRCRHRHHDILLARLEDQYYAISNLCSHEDAPLHLGCLKNGEIQCTLHSARFDVRSGAATAEPASEPVRQYAVIVDAGTVWIDTGDA